MTGQPGPSRSHPVCQFGNQRRHFLPADGDALRRWLAVDFALDGEDCIDLPYRLDRRRRSSLFGQLEELAAL
jgi:hypothetical protein